MKSSIVYLFFIYLSISALSTTCFSQNFYDIGLKNYNLNVIDSTTLFYFTNAIENNQSISNSHMYRGAVKFLMGDLKGAFADVDRSIQINPQNSKAYYYQGKLQYVVGDIDFAITCFNLSIELDSSDADAHDGRAISFAQKGDIINAIKDETKAINLKPNEGSYYENRAIIKYLAKMYEESIEDCNKALMLEKTTTAHTTKGKCYFELENYNEAIYCFSRAIEEYSKINDLFYFRGISYYKIGLSDDACKDLTKSVELGNITKEQADKFCK